MHQRHADNRGFTLIEALVAASILIIGLVPAFEQASNALKLSTTIQNLLIASNLAQEGVEVVHAIRDANWFALQDFRTGLTIGASNCTAGCRVQWDSASIMAAAATPLNIDASGMYTYNAGAATGFVRTMTITAVSATEMKVIAVVTWSDRGVARSFTVEDYLFDWN